MSPKCWARMRPSVSDVPPGATGEMMRTGCFVGQSDDAAGRDIVVTARIDKKAAAQAIVVLRIIILSLIPAYRVSRQSSLQMRARIVPKGLLRRMDANAELPCTHQIAAVEFRAAHTARSDA